jgi:hypothetical protein
MGKATGMAAPAVANGPASGTSVANGPTSGAPTDAASGTTDATSGKT